jgi:quercetin dioxygenase-like cupin family protein
LLRPFHNLRLRLRMNYPNPARDKEQEEERPGFFDEDCDWIPRVHGGILLHAWRRKRSEKSNMKLTDNQQVLHHRGNVLVRRQRLAPGEATRWHRDPFHRVTVVLSGDLLSIEFRDSGETAAWNVTIGEVNWVEPTDRLHRAVNVGKEPFEEVVTFFLDRPDAVPQPEADSQ